MSKLWQRCLEVRGRQLWACRTARHSSHAVAAAQCEDVTAALEAAKRPGARVAEPATPTSKLHAAALHDNDRFLAAEGDQQQLLLRCALLAAVCCRAGVVGVKGTAVAGSDPHCRLSLGRE